MNDIKQNNCISLENLPYIWQTYSEELLQWKNHTENEVCPDYLSASMDDDENITRLARLGQIKKVSYYLLLGVNIAHILQLASLLQNLQSNAHILVVADSGTQAALCRDLLQENQLGTRVHLLYDSSPFALFMLTFCLGLLPENCSLFFCQPPQLRSETLLTFRKLFLSAGWEKVQAPKSCEPSQSLSLHVILHPDEPHLQSFFAHIPVWIHEVLVLWDAQTPVERTYSCKAPVRYFTHPLQGDFSAQRNRLLAQSTGDFVLYLDADERLEHMTWNCVRNFLQDTYGAGVIFPRLTFEGDNKHVRMGHGLWPDVQLRLFAHKQRKDIHFVNTVHEKLEGLMGAPVLVPQLPILHYSHIFKTAHELEQRMAVFNAAGNFTHTLSAQYPSLAEKFFLQWLYYVDNSYVIRLF